MTTIDIHTAGELGRELDRVFRLMAKAVEAEVDEMEIRIRIIPDNVLFLPQGPLRITVKKGMEPVVRSLRKDNDS